MRDNIGENRIEGKNAVLECLNAKRGIKKLFVLKSLKDNKINSIIDDLKRTGTIIKFLERDELDNMAETRAHQGIIAEAEDYKYVEVSDILDYAKSKNEDPFVVILDEIEDPHNFGAIIRSAECVGAHGIIIKNRNQAMVTATVVSASAGASEHMRIARVTNISKTIEELKNDGMWFACADMDGTEMTKTNLKGSIGLVVGNEGSGVSRLVKEKCDFIVKIPMKGHIDSLNVSVATGILLYEINRQRCL
ncbi:MAG: 23S rRNA (guanosine(2251)-2'-O)-methyltransferase RlmB [Lachnospiraceae bacterium]|nr:23S rRNA (guanosine(2251)-2'-O)-methyltransferase RlmB [Lachnospiraceae bacterium]